MKWLKKCIYCLIHFILRTFKVGSIILVVIFIFFTGLNIFFDGETLLTNRLRIIKRLEHKAFPLLEKYRLSAIEKESLYYSTGSGYTLPKDPHLAINELPLEQQKIFKEIAQVTLKNNFLERDFKEARIEFDDTGKINYAEFYFNCSCYDKYIYSPKYEKNFGENLPGKNYRSNEHISKDWYLSKD